MSKNKRKTFQSIANCKIVNTNQSAELFAFCERGRRWKLSTVHFLLKYFVALNTRSVGYRNTIIKEQLSGRLILIIKQYFFSFFCSFKLQFNLNFNSCPTFHLQHYTALLAQEISPLYASGLQGNVCMKLFQVALKGLLHILFAFAYLSLDLVETILLFRKMQDIQNDFCTFITHKVAIIYDEEVSKALRYKIA